MAWWDPKSPSPAYEQNIHEGAFTDNDRILKPTDPQREYRRRATDGKSVIHWGQRKLLLSEIEFLTHYSELSTLVVYAGAAPGSHIPILCEMFPKHQFVLYDPNQFDPVLSKYPQITTIQEYFMDKDAEYYLGKDVLFISDIRTANPTLMTEDEITERINKDNEWMLQWCQKMKPKKALLKWKLPYGPGSTKFLGYERIFLPIWGPVTTTECRLVPITDPEDPNYIKVYDHVEYEQQLFYFNTVKRLTYYHHDVEADGLDHCFDCMSEIFVLGLYLEKKDIIEVRAWTPSKERRDREIGRLSERISLQLGTPLSKYRHRVTNHNDKDKQA